MKWNVVVRWTIWSIGLYGTLLEEINIFKDIVSNLKSTVV